jgi:hypothetical protein|tara:strand:+ start:150 stop:383 length:234 start_codon:yes stop_codon:yes gene_type:complete
MEKTSEIDGSYFTTHPYDEYNGDGVSLTDKFAELREEYTKSGKKIISMKTYYNSGFNHTTQQDETEPEFGVEIEWIW